MPYLPGHRCLLGLTYRAHSNTYIHHRFILPLCLLPWKCWRFQPLSVRDCSLHAKVRAERACGRPGTFAWILSLPEESSKLTNSLFNQYALQWSVWNFRKSPSPTASSPLVLLLHHPPFFFCPLFWIHCLSNAACLALC